MGLLRVGHNWATSLSLFTFMHWRRKWQPTSVFLPGGGCHFLLQCMKVKSESEVTQSCPTLHYPKDCSLPGSSIHGIFQARVLEWGAIAFSTAGIVVMCIFIWRPHYFFLPFSFPSFRPFSFSFFFQSFHFAFKEEPFRFTWFKTGLLEIQF